MKVLRLVFVVLALLAVFGSARGDIQSPVSGEDEFMQIRYRELKDMLIDCLRPHDDGKIIDDMRDAHTSEEYGEILKGYCDNSSTSYECLDWTNAVALRRIPDPIEAGKMTVRTKFLEHMLRVSCELNGARLVPLFREIFSRIETTKRESFIKKCTFSVIDSMDLTSGTVSQFNLQLYQILTTFKACVVESIKGYEEPFADSIAFLNQATDTMSCIDEQSRTNISCKSVAAIQCELHGLLNIGDSSEPSVVLSRDTALCYLEGKDSSSIRIEFKEANSTEDFQTIVKKICDVKSIAKSCIAQTKLVGELCLLGKNLDIFRGMMNLLEVTHRISCVDEGVRLSNILAEIKKSSPEHRQSIDTCFDSVERGLKSEEAEDTDFKLIQYHVMKRFTNCIAEFGRDHNQAFVDAAAFLGEGVEMLTCPDEENRGFVLCNTLPDNL